MLFLVLIVKIFYGFYGLLNLLPYFLYNLLIKLLQLLYLCFILLNLNKHPPIICNFTIFRDIRLNFINFLFQNLIILLDRDNLLIKILQCLEFFILFLNILILNLLLRNLGFKSWNLSNLLLQLCVLVLNMFYLCV